MLFDSNNWFPWDLWHLSVTFLINSNFNLTLTQSIWEMRCLSEKNSKRSQQTHCSKQTNKQGSWTQLFTIFSILIHHVFFFLQLWITFCSATQPIPKKLIKLWMTFAQRSQSRKSLGRATPSPPHVVPGPPLPRRGEIWRWITLTFLTTWPAGWTKVDRGEGTILTNKLLTPRFAPVALSSEVNFEGCGTQKTLWTHLEGSLKTLHGSWKALEVLLM